MESKITVPNPDPENSIKYPALFESIDDEIIVLAISKNEGGIIYTDSNKPTRKIGLGFNKKEYWIDFDNTAVWRPFKGTVELKG